MEGDGRPDTLRKSVFKRLNIPKLRQDIKDTGTDEAASLILERMEEDTARALGPKAIQQQIMIRHSKRLPL